MKIREFKKDDLDQIARVHKAAFVRQHLSREWIECNSRAYPRDQYFVAETEENKIVGYIHWTQKSGFRPEVVLELSQLAVLPEFQGRGIGKKLICGSLPKVSDHLAERNAKIKHILVTTRADNHAQKMYKKTLGAEVEATIKDLYSADEVFMVARNIKI